MKTPFSPDPRSPFFSRREMLKTLSSGFRYLAFAGLAARAAEQSAAPSSLARLKQARDVLGSVAEVF